jgi:DNA-binding NarL/FixJ family response regulator
MEESVGRLDRSPDQLSIAANGSLATVPTPRSVALIDMSRLRRECLRLALAQHNAHWRVSEFASAEELQRALDSGAPPAELVLIGAATAEHVDLRQLELVCESLPETPVVVIAENGHPQRARQILSTGARGFLPTNLSLKVLMGALDLVLAGGVYVPSSLLDAAPQRAAERAVVGADTPAARRSRAHLAGQIEQAHRRRPLYVGEHGQGACEADHQAAARLEPHPSGAARHRSRPLPALRHDRAAERPRRDRQVTACP